VIQQNQELSGRTLGAARSPKKSIGVPNPDLTIEQRRALQLLAEAANGMTDAALRVHGFSPILLSGLSAPATRRPSRAL
jgi:hypothetical protein